MKVKLFIAREYKKGKFSGGVYLSRTEMEFVSDSPGYGYWASQISGSDTLYVCLPEAKKLFGAALLPRSLNQKQIEVTFEAVK